MSSHTHKVEKAQAEFREFVVSRLAVGRDEQPAPRAVTLTKDEVLSWFLLAHPELTEFRPSLATVFPTHDTFAIDLARWQGETAGGCAG